MTDKEKQELYENICNDINCGTYILAPQYVDKLLAKLERKIASIRGSHRVDLAKLNARIEQVERLKKENAELKSKKGCESCTKFDEVQLTKAKEYIKLLLMNCVGVYESTGKTIAEIQAEAEQFLKEE
jgi:hypothetical protein